jgi:hypothetical protein
MVTHRLTRAVVIACAIAAVAAPAASARPVDAPAGYTLPQEFQTADTRDTVTPPSQDLRHADTRDYVDGRGTYNSPDVVVLKAAQPVPQPTSSGIHWEDVGIGAGSLLALGLIALGGGALVVRRSAAKQLAG